MKKLNDDLELALAGRGYWLKLKEKYCIYDDCYLILLPERDERLNKSAVRNLIEFLGQKYIRRAVVLSTYYNMDEMLLHKREEDVKFGRISLEEMRAILKYYRLSQFAKNIAVVSMEEPFGNRNIIGKAGITLDDYVRNAIYV